MAKKSKAARRASRTNASPSTVVARPVAAPTPRPAAVSGVSGGRRPFEREFNPDYTYVFKDLKRIGTLAGTFFVLLIVLSFFLK
jgi:hypothetical protein